MELLEDLTHFLEEFKETLNTLEQCVDFKEYEELEYWRSRAEVGFCSDLKYFYVDRYILVNDLLLKVKFILSFCYMEILIIRNHVRTFKTCIHAWTHWDI